MGTLIAEVAALGLAVAFTSPVSVVTVIVLLSLPAGRRRAIAFVCGWLIAIAGIGALTVYVFHDQDFSSKHSSPSQAASGFEIFLGCLILFGSMVSYRRRKPSESSPSAPKWLDRVAGTHWLIAAAVGALMLSYALSLAAFSEILKANVNTLDSAAAIVVFALTSIVTVTAPIVVVLVTPDRADRTLARWKAWVLGNSSTVVLVVLMVVGTLLIVRGIYDLAA